MIEDIRNAEVSDRTQERGLAAAQLFGDGGRGDLVYVEIRSDACGPLS